MCHKSPGPRCDQEVLTTLLIAQQRDASHSDLFVEEHCELLMTRGGLSALAMMIQSSEGADQNSLLKAYKTGYANFIRKMDLIGKTPRVIKDHPDLDDVEFERDVEQLATVSSRLYSSPHGPLNEKVKVLNDRLGKNSEHVSKFCDVKVVERAHADKPSLKDVTIVGMQEELRGITKGMALEDCTRVLEAASLAEYLHRNDVRKTPARNSSGIAVTGTDPYIIHPLRNTLRISRWGCNDANMLVACLLHDTVEDHAKDIAVEYCGSDSDATEEEHRQAAYAYLNRTFGPDAANYVRLMSNPILDKATRYNKEKSDNAYAAHVKEAVTESPHVLVLKISDFIDNALSAHHGIIDKRTIARTKKYAPLVPTFANALDKHKEALHSLVTYEGIQAIGDRVARAERYLSDIIALEKNV